MTETNVLVLGGGPAGIGAALGAAWAGASVTLVERHDVVGGMGTSALVNIFANAHFDGSRLIIGGAFGRIRQALIERGRLYATTRARQGEPYDPVAFVQVSNAMLTDAGVDVRTGASVSQLQLGEGPTVRGMVGDEQITARVLVDATGDAVVAPLAGTSFDFGDTEADNAVMPLTYCFLCGPADLERISEAQPKAIRRDPHSGEPYIYYTTPNVKAAIHEAQAEGWWTVPRDNGAIFSVPGRREVLSVNLTRVFIDDPTDPKQLAAADAEGRAQIDQCIRLFREKVVGLENVELLEVARQIGVRESRRVRGVYRLTRDDAVSCRQFDDAVTQCCYGIDDHSSHHATWKMDHHFEPGTHFDVPWRCLVPADGCPTCFTPAGVSAGTARR